VISTILVTGATAALREALIAAALQPSVATAVILEGLPSGISPLDDMTSAPLLHIARIAPGCLCCTGNLTMRVTLNRLLRKHPVYIYIGLVNAAHLENLRGFLQKPPYAAFLNLVKELHA
jgi:G3E family GTPase